MIAALRRPIDALYNAPILLLTLTALFWGGNAVAGRLAIGHITPLTLVFLRWLLVLIVLWPIYGGQIREHWPDIKPRLGSIGLMAFLGFTGFNVLFYFGAHYTTAINIGILQGSIPVFVLVGAFLAHGARTTPLQLVGVLITLAGVVVVATRGEPRKILDLDPNGGDLAMLELLDRIGVAKMQLLYLDVKRLEQQAPSNGRAASRLAEIDHLTVQLLDVGYPGGHHKVDLLVEQLGVDAPGVPFPVRHRLSVEQRVVVVTTDLPDLLAAVGVDDAAVAVAHPEHHEHTLEVWLLDELQA